MKIAMNTLFSSLLVASALALLAQKSQAQLVVASAHTSHGGYVHARGNHASNRFWIPGRYETVCEQFWVPGCTERVWVEPAHDLRVDACGNRFRVLVCAGFWRTIEHPGHFETRRVRVWQPGHWSLRGSCD